MIQRSSQAVEKPSGQTEHIHHQKHDLATTESRIAITSCPESDNDWQSILSNSAWKTKDLLAYLGIEEHPLANENAESLFPLRVPQPYLEKIERGNPNDPLLLQVLPQSSENLLIDGYVNDPLEEQQSTPVPGVIHKYRSRVLLVTTQACAIHCRYCFRRNFPYQNHRLSREQWRESLEYIEQHDTVNEVILSGGDPLSLNNQYLTWLLGEIDKIDHIKRIRIHTRLPLCIPQRIDSELTDSLRNLESQCIFVIHSNHPNEIGPNEAKVFNKLKNVGVSIFNQSVMLKGVNNCPKILTELSERLFDAGVQPYYLFTLDKTAGAAHFDLDEQVAKKIYYELQASLPGFLVPKLAKEIPGKPFKEIL